MSKAGQSILQGARQALGFAQKENADTIVLVMNANPDRQTQSIERRLIKLQEEVGELADAYLSYTTPSNPKNKTWRDITEEAVDTAIVAIDIALSLPESMQDMEPHQMLRVREMFKLKLQVWVDKVANQTGTT